MQPGPTSRHPIFFDQKLIRELHTVQRFGYLAMCGGVLLLLATFDLLGSEMAKTPGQYAAVVGQILHISGSLARLEVEMNTKDSLRFIVSHPAITVSAAEVTRDFWLGLPIYRATIEIGPDIRPGEYVLQYGAALPTDSRLETIKLLVYKDESALFQHDGSHLRRWLGSALWPSFAMLLLLTCLSALKSIQASRERLRMLGRAGVSEVFRVVHEEDSSLLWFSLHDLPFLDGANEVWLLDDRGKFLIPVALVERFDTYATARISKGSSVRPGFWVAISTG